MDDSSPVIDWRTRALDVLQGQAVDTHQLSPDALQQLIVAMQALYAEQQQERAELRQREAQFRLLVEHTSEPIVVIQNGIVCFANAAAETAFGNPSGGLRGYELGMPATIDRTELDVLDIGNPSAVAEMHVVEIAWEGQPAVLASLHDITRYAQAAEELEQCVYDRTAMLQHAVQHALIELSRREQAEYSLRQSEARYRAISELISDYAFAYRFEPDGSTAMEWVGGASTNITGYTTEELFASGSWTRIVHPDDVAIVAESTEQMLLGRPNVCEFRIMAKDGTIQWLRVHVQPIWDTKQQRIGRVYGAAQNITQRKEAELALRESEEKFRGVVEQTSDGIIITDEQGYVVEWNCGAEQISSLAREEVVGTAAWEVLYRLLPDRHKTPERYRRIQSLVQEFFINGHAPWMNQLHESEIQHTDGTRHYIQQLAFPIQTRRGLILCATMRDITERKQNERDLQEAREAAESATQAKSKFLANMSHEMRTPLNAVIGMTTLLHDTELTMEQYDFVETIRTSGNALLAIINDILDFSKIEAGRMALEYQPFHLRTCVEEALDLLASEAARKCLDLACVIDDTIPSVLIGDATRLRQILVNLLSNAVKFTDAGEVVVSVETLQPDDDTTRPEIPPAIAPAHPHTTAAIHISVRDTGIGIPRKDHDVLFQSFSQIDTRGRKQGGTGLGLAISKRLVNLMGGQMWFESEEGQGSTFHLSLAAEVSPHDPSNDWVYLNPNQPLLAGKRVLIVGDNNATSRLILTQRVESWKMQTTTATSLDAVARLFEREHITFDIIIVDMRLTQTNTQALIADIRACPQAREIPIIVFVSLQEWGKAARNTTNPNLHYITRPVKLSQLYNALISRFSKDTFAHPLSTRWKQDRAALPNPRAPSSARSSLRILLAEDNVVNQKIALRLLERMGYRADVASNGVEALEALERQPYDAVLMDIQMPEMDGIEATRHIRARWPVEQQPAIIAMTAHVLDGDREWYLSAGMDDFVGKPVRVGELMECLRRVENRDQRGRNERCDCRTTDNPPEPRSLPVPPIPLSTSEPSAAPPPPPPLDEQQYQMFLEMIGNEPEVVNGFLDLFMNDVPQKTLDMRQALLQSQYAQLRLATHSLKSSSAQLGAKVLSQLCKELEECARTTTVEGAEKLVLAIEAEYERVREVLRKKMR